MSLQGVLFIETSAVAGVTGTPSRCCFQLPLRTSAFPRQRIVSLPCAWKPAQNYVLLRLQRSHWAGVTQRFDVRKTHVIKCAMDASFGDISDEPMAMDANKPDEPIVIFPRMNLRDPYKLLGISREASEEEIIGARNFLVRQYAKHKPSVEAIESAHSQIIWKQIKERRNPKIDYKKKLRAVSQSRVVQAVRSRFRTPATQFIVKTSIAFIVLGALSFLFPTEEGPTLQVAISLLATLYFIHERLQSKWRAFLYSGGAFVFSWLVGTFLMVAVIPPIPFIKGLRSFEVITSLITYVLLWVASTYLK